MEKLYCKRNVFKKEIVNVKIVESISMNWWKDKNIKLILKLKHCQNKITKNINKDYKHELE